MLNFGVLSSAADIRQEIRLNVRQSDESPLGVRTHDKDLINVGRCKSWTPWSNKEALPHFVKTQSGRRKGTATLLSSFARTGTFCWQIIQITLTATRLRGARS